MKSVFLKILLFVIMIDLFYMAIGRLYLTQAEKHPPPVLEITEETDMDTLVGMGESLLKNKGGCLLCHKISEVGNTRGPDLRGVAGRAASRRPNMTAEAYLMESLVEPGAYVVEEFATPGGDSIMPAANKPPADMSPTEIKALIAYLQSQSGEITVKITASDVAGAAQMAQDKPPPAPSHPGFALLTSKGCSACHDTLSEERRVGPALTTVGERLTAAEILESIVDPNAVIAEGYQKDLMLKNFGETLSAEELDQLVGFLSGEVGLSKWLSHPGIHLLLLILLFNGAVGIAVRKIEARETSPGWIGAAGSILMIGGLYWYWSLPAPDPSVLALESAITTNEISAVLPIVANASTSEPKASASGAESHDGEALFKFSCPACHGQDAKGLPGLGKDITSSPFMDGLSDRELAEFIKVGRAADDPMNTTGVAMPPKGLNSSLSDDEMMAIVEYMRSLGR